MRTANDIYDDLLDRAAHAVLDQAPKDQPPGEVVSATKSALGRLNQDCVLAGELVRSQSFSRRAIIAIAVAATLLAIIAPMFLKSSGGGKVYGIETLAQRLLTLRSLHVRGFLVREIVNDERVKETKRFPIRWFFERPNRLWMETYGFTDSGDEQATTVRRHTNAIDSNMQVIVDSDSGQRYVVPIDPRTTELNVELMIQSFMFAQLLNAPQDHFEKICSEQLDGLACDLYEKKAAANPNGMGSLQRIWFNPRDGMPRRMDVFHLLGDDEPQLVMTLTDIQVNVDAPSDLFPLAPLPENPITEFSGIVPVGSATAGPVNIGTWYALRLSATKAIACWTQREMTNDKTTWFANEAIFSSSDEESSNALGVHTLREFESKGVRWRWSLVTLPSNTKHDRGAINLSVTFDGHTATVGVFPLQFPEERLLSVFDDLQSLTPGNIEQEKLTLDTVLKEGTRATE